MKRWLTRILICLLLGTMFTTAVAWTCALTVNMYEGQKRAAFVGSERRMLEITRWDAFASTRIYSTFSEGSDGFAEQRGDPTELTPSWAIELIRPTDEFMDDAVFSDTRWIEARGWPWPALRTSGGMLLRRENSEQERPTQAGIELSMEPWATPGGRLSTPRVLPLRPIVPGMLLNILVYAVAVYMLLFLPFDARRAVRRRRGCCQRCGHQLDAQQAECPECGRPRDASADHTSAANADVLELIRAVPLSVVLDVLLRAVVCIVIGVVVTIAVAVACSLIVNVYEQEPRIETEVSVMSSNRAKRYDAFGSMRIHAIHWRYRIGEQQGGDAYERLFPDYARDTRLRNDNIRRLRRSERFVDGRGWPFRALVTEVDISREDAEYVAGMPTSTWTEPGDTSRTVPRVIPLAPIWSGVLLNTLIYSVAAYILLVLPIDLFRRWRVRRKKRRAAQRHS